MRRLPTFIAVATLTTAAFGMAPAAAGTGDSVRGAVQNRVAERGRPSDTRHVSVHADDDGGTSGRLNFRHYRHEPASEGDVAGLSKFRGTVTCLEVNDAVVRINGTVISGSTRTGKDLTGALYAIQFDLDEEQFTLPAFGEERVPGDGDGCMTSGPTPVDITSGRLEIDG